MLYDNMLYDAGGLCKGGFSLLPPVKVRPPGLRVRGRSRVGLGLGPLTGTLPRPEVPGNAN